MSSYLKITSSEEPIMPNLTGLALIKWILSNVHEGEFGTCCDNKVYLNWSELSWGMYDKFKEAVYSLTKKMSIEELMYSFQLRQCKVCTMNIHYTLNMKDLAPSLKSSGLNTVKQLSFMYM